MPGKTAISPIHRLLRSLVRRPSVNPMGRKLISPTIHLENRVSSFLRAWADRRDIPHSSQFVAPGRENIVMEYSPPAPTRTILFEVHQDTVPVTGMTIRPFSGGIRDGKLYGRGACDVKGGMAAMLGTLARLHREKPIRSARVVLACTVDEEHTFLGVQELMRNGLQADFAICAEPTNLQIVDAHKGLVRWEVKVAGRACHSSNPAAGVSAIYRMAKLLSRIERYAAHLNSSKIDPRLGSPTISVGRIDGGVSVNTVPDSCRIEVDRRLIPGEKVEDSLEAFQQFLKCDPTIDFPFEVGPIWLTCPALEAGNNAQLASRLGAAIDSVIGSHQVLAVPFGTDGSSIAEAGIPCVVFGPGDIAQAHTNDEWIELKQVEQAAEILYRFAVSA